MAERFKERKVKPSDNDYDPQKCGFNETVKFKVLHCGNVEGNNNKFYCIELQKNSKTGHYRLFSHYGRLVTSEVFGIRDFDHIDNGPVTDIALLEKEIDAIVKKKLRGKTVKDEKTGETWRENYEEVQTFAPTVGSSNIRGKSQSIVTPSSKGTKVAVDTSTISNAKIVRIINQIVDENIHSITATTSLKLSSSGFETPLGPVTREHVQKARGVLDILKAEIKDNSIDPGLESVIKANNLFFSLIPHAFGRKITQSDMILDSTKLIAEYDMLEQLESAVQMGAALTQTATQKINALGVDMEELPSSNSEFARLRDYVRNSKAANHRGSDVYHWDVENIFTIKIPQERQRFETQGKSLGNIKELFHGSKNCNILSILKNGLIIPPHNASYVTGRFLGNGIYGAHNSSKSLNYSTGFWAGSGNKYRNSFLFIVNFAMGKADIVYHGTDRPKPGFNSLWAKSGNGSSLHNDEYVVFNLYQATITHIIEMVK
jgi:poly [ADP-ribose] polymerase